MSLKALWGNSDSERWTGNGERKMKNGERKMKNGERKVKNGERKMKNGKRRTWNGERRAKAWHRKYMERNRVVGKVRGSDTSVNSGGVLSHLKSLFYFCSYCVFLLSLFFLPFSLFIQYFLQSLLCLLKCIREVDSRIYMCGPRHLYGGPLLS